MCYVVDMTEYAVDLPELPDPLSINTISRQLGLARAAATELLYSGLADKLTGMASTYRIGNVPTLTPTGLAALLAVPSLDPPEDEPAVNVRVRAARAVGDSDRALAGWRASLSPDDLDTAIARWWPTPRIDVAGRLFVATIAGFVVAAGRITDLTIDRGRAAYHVDWEDSVALGRWEGRRIPSPRGGPVVYLPEGLA